MEAGEQRAFWTRLLVGLAITWLALDRSAALTQSTMGEAGLLVGALAVAATLACERLLFRTPLREAPRRIGLGRPNQRSLSIAAGLLLLLLAFYPAFAIAKGVPVMLRDGWLGFVPGLFAQGGIGEEVVFRGYLYGHLRERHGFWRAALLAVPPFAAAHLLLFATLPPPIALAALIVSISLTFPFARLYDLSGGTIWPAALLHCAIQGSIKLVFTEDPATYTTLALGWMAFSTLLPWAVFAVRERPEQAEPPAPP